MQNEIKLFRNVAISIDNFLTAAAKPQFMREDELKELIALIQNELERDLSTSEKHFFDSYLIYLKYCKIDSQNQ